MNSGHPFEIQSDISGLNGFYSEWLAKAISLSCLLRDLYTSAITSAYQCSFTG
jgi:hypothetical protein